MIAVLSFSVAEGRSELDISNSSFLDITILAYSINDKMVYYASMIMTIFTTILAYFFLFDFCEEMTKFEFQPDQRIMDQFI